MIKNNREKAFTLVELLIVIAIIAILTLAFLPNVLRAPAKARDAIRLKQVSDIANAVEVYATEKGNPPASEIASGAVNCFTLSVATTLGVVVPTDQKNLDSCGAGAGSANADKLYYRYVSTVTPPFYIVGAKLEASSAANTWATYADQTAGGAPAPCTGSNNGVNTVNTLACARALLGSAIATGATEYWRIAVGPQ